MTNTEFYVNLFDKTEDAVSSMMGQFLAQQGVGLDEVDEDIVKIWNQYVRFWKEMKGLAYTWAQSQDQRDADTKKALEQIEMQNKELKLMLQKVLDKV